MPGPYPLPTLSPIVDPNGITIVQFEDILASLRASYMAVYGSDCYLEPDSQDGQWLAVQAAAIYDLGQTLASVYFSYNPSFAQGVGLSSIVKINGLQRQEPSQSSVEMRLVGQAGTLIPNGVVIDASGNPWDLPASITIPERGEITVIALARNPGQFLAPANTITRIEESTHVAGWQTANNPHSAAPGAPIETDPQLRRRQHRSTSLPAITPVGGIYGVLANISGAGRVEVYVNDKDYVDENGIPGHSISCILDGGDPNEIARAINLKKSPGTGTYGSTTVEIVDKAVMPQSINFFYTRRIEVFVEVTLIPRTGFVSSTLDLIRQSVALFINELRVGWTVYRAWLAAPASLAGDMAMLATGLDQFQLHRLADTYVLAQILLGTDPDQLSTNDIKMHFTEAGLSNVSGIGIIIRQ